MVSRRMGSMEKESIGGIHRYIIGIARLLLIYSRDVDNVTTPPTAHYGRDTPMVFAIPTAHRTHYLCTVAIQVDTVVRHNTVRGVHLYKYPQA